MKYQVPRASVFYMSYCPSVHVLTSIASVDTIHPSTRDTYTVASALYILKLFYNSTVSMVTDAIIHILYIFSILCE